MPKKIVKLKMNQAMNNIIKPSDYEVPSTLRYSADYFITLPGIIKIIEFILGMACMALAAPPSLDGTHFFVFTISMSFVNTFIWMGIYFFCIKESDSLRVDWLVTEMVGTGICTLFYAMAIIIQLVIWSCDTDATYQTKENEPRYGKPYVDQNINAGIVASANTIVYALGMYLLYRERKQLK